MPKKILPLLLCIALMLGMTACGEPTAENTPPASPSAPVEQLPSEQPSEVLSEEPSEVPSETPSEAPSEEPSETPSEEPSELPSEEPSETPSEGPSELPSEEPSEAPSEEPGEGPAPSEEPSEAPSTQPSEAPSEEPSPSPVPSAEPTPEPSPSAQPTPKPEPSKEPEPVELLEGCWEGVGVDYTRDWHDGDDAAMLATMPNTAKVIEQYGDLVAYGANWNGPSFVASNGKNESCSFGLVNNRYTDALTFVGSVYSYPIPASHDICVAMIKDVMDAESATALIRWIEGLDELHQELINLIIRGKSGTPEEKDCEARFDAYIESISNDFVIFGNVEVMWDSRGNFIIRNK